MVNKKFKRIFMVLTLCMTLMRGSSINAYAYVDESAGAEATTEAVTVKEELTVETENEEIGETTTESDNLSLLDDVGADKAKNLEYMTVQTKKRCSFYLVIDKIADTENVYFLNQVDELDLMAIMDDAQKQEYESSIGLCLRDKEKTIEKDIQDGIDGKKAEKLVLNDMFDLYMAGKHELKQSTRTNYLYMYKKYVSETIGKNIVSIKYSDIKRFYNSLIRDQGFKPNSMEIINIILHPTFTLAVRDGYIRNNPTDGVMAEIKKSHNWEKPKRHALVIRGFCFAENYHCLTDKDVLYFEYGKPESQAAYPLLSEGLTLQTKERRAMPMYVTYSDLIQIGIFIVALVGLCYTVFKGRRK